MSDRTAPESKNYLRNNSFKFTINKIPNVNFYVQEANIPNISVDFVETKTLFAQPDYDTGGRYSYGDLNIRFIVDENMNNYLELYNWIRSEMPIESYAGIDKDPLEDGTLMVLNNSYRANVVVKFKELYPISLDEINFDLTTTDPDPIIIGASFKHNGMEISTV